MMASVSPPKPWEKRGVTETGAGSSNTSLFSAHSPSTSTSAATLSSNTNALAAPAVPERPSTLTSVVNRTASTYSPYAANRLGTTPYGGIGGPYSSPYSRMAGMSGYGAFGSNMYGAVGGIGGYGSIYGGMAPMGPYDPNDANSLTNSLSRSTLATFQVIESIVNAFGGFAQMLESTYMATHSSFFAMVSVAEQFGNLRNTLGSILGIFTILRWLRTLFAKITGRQPPVDAIALTPAAFASFEGRTVLPGGTPVGPPRLSKKPFLVFLVAAFGLPYLMGKLIRSLATSQEEAERNRFTAAGQIQASPDGRALSAQQIDPSKLDFCRVLYDFTPETGAAVQGVDLEVKKGDLVAVLSKSDPLGNPSEWWRCRARNGRVGYLPGVYLTATGRPGQAVAQIKSASQSDSRTNDLDSKTTPSVQGGAGNISVESFQKSHLNS